MTGLFDNNMDNIPEEVDLFGNRIEKLSMRDRIGFHPISIWVPDWGKAKKFKDIIGDSGQSRENCFQKPDASGKRLYTTEVSIFNPYFAQMILSAYCPSGARIYDPFAGGGTRGLVASAMGHKYYGVELRQEEVERIRAHRKTLGREFHIRQGDSREYFFEPREFDFSYTCPPYYDLEVYSDLPEDMSNASSYKIFLEMLLESMRGVYRGLKPGSLSAWVVGDFRDKKGELRSFHSDLIPLAKGVGFQLHDIIILWTASGNAAQRCGSFEANRKSVRVHQYLMLFKKP